MTTHLIGLRAENFKRLALVDVTFPPEGGVVAIMGRNEAGKSSLLDAFEAAIAPRGGPKMAAPVHTGADSARIVATFDDIVVTRTYAADGGTRLEVKSADGRRMGNPEDILRALYSHVAFDPLEFSRLNAADQVATLLPVIGFNPEPLQREHDDAYRLRTDVKRDRDALAARVAAFPDVNPNLPREEVSVADLSAELERALAVNAERARIAAEVEKRVDAIATREAEVERLRARITELTDECAVIAEAQAEDRQKLATVAAVDVEPIRAQIADAESINARVRQQTERAAVAGELAAAQQHVADLDATIARTKADRKAALEKASMPVPGLAVDDEAGVLTLNGVPFSQASTGVKIRTGTAIAMALNPDLRVIVIRDASLLDVDNRAVIDQLAVANEFLVLLEIADESMPVGVVIEDGAVREVRS